MDVIMKTDACTYRQVHVHTHTHRNMRMYKQ